MQARPSIDPGHPGEVLELKDLVTGQVAFWRSALRLTLVDGHRAVDVAASYQGVTLEFSSAAHADLRVPFAQLQHFIASLASEPRVSSMQLAPVRLPRRTK